MSETSVNQRKVAMIGCGFVGSATAFALMESGLFSEMVLIDADKNRAEGEALDISHGLPFARPMKIYAGDYDDIVDAAIIIVTAGANQKPDETRLDLVQKNVGIFKSISRISIGSHGNFFIGKVGFLTIHATSIVIPLHIVCTIHKLG